MERFFTLFFFFVLTNYAVKAQFSQPGELDTTFNFGKPHAFFNNPMVPNPAHGSLIGVKTVEQQADGKHLVAGRLISYDDRQLALLFRLNANGSYDTSFRLANGLQALSIVEMVKAQPDGKIFIGNAPLLSSGFRGLARLNANGSLDNGFQISVALTMRPKSMVVQSDGKIVVVGTINVQQGPNIHIIRLNANGTIDSTFTTGTGPNGTVEVVALQPDNKLLVGGNFTAFNGTVVNRIVRLNSNGTIDTTFNTNGGANGTVRLIAVQPDQKIIMAGSFNQYGGTLRARIVRLHANGSLDLSFDSGIGPSGNAPALGLQADGKIVIGGDFPFYQNEQIYRLVRINPNGSIDTTFRPRQAPDYPVTGLFIQNDGKIVIAGTFSNVNNVRRAGLARLHANGDLDVTYFSRTGPSNIVDVVLPQPDGKVLLGGIFMSYSDSSSRGIARIHENGTLDASFNTTLRPYSQINAIVLQPDGKLLIGGKFTHFAETTRYGIARLHPNGALDTSFNPGNAITSNVVNGFVKAMVLQPDGKLVIAGDFNSYNGMPSKSVLRLHADGSLDSTFESDLAQNVFVKLMLRLPDGKLLISTDSGTDRLMRLHANGSRDTSFLANAFASNLIVALTLQPDGKILIGGNFNSFGGITRRRIARLHANGTVDLGFNPGLFSTASSSTSTLVSAIAVQADGKIIIGGDFGAYQGVVRMGMARLNMDGSLDTVFNPRMGINQKPFTAIPLSGEKMLISGAFTTYDGVDRPYLARIFYQNCAVEVTNTTPSTAICAGSSKRLTGTIGGIWIQVTGPGSILDSTYFASGGSGIVTLYNQMGGCTSPWVTFLVHPTPVANIIQVGDTLKADSTVGNYQWLLNGAAIAGANASTFIARIAGAYRLIVTNSAGCSDTSNTIQVAIAGILNQQAEAMTWSTYPVPFEGQLTIEAKSSFAYELLDLRGRVLLRGATENQSTVLQTDHLSAGVYLVKVVMNGQTAVRRVVKR